MTGPRYLVPGEKSHVCQEANREYREFFKALAMAVGGSEAAAACASRLSRTSAFTNYEHDVVLVLQVRARGERVAAAAAEPAGSGLRAAGALSCS